MTWAGTSYSWVMMGGQRWAQLWALDSEPLYVNGCVTVTPGLRGSAVSDRHRVMLPEGDGDVLAHVLGASEPVTAERCGRA